MFRNDLLAGKKILVTGGGTGLGKSIGRRYLELGAHLVICGRRLAVLDATADEFRAELPGARVDTLTCDVRDAEQVEAMMEGLWRTGPLDVLVNNAAANFIARTDKLSARAVDAVLNIVLHGSFYCAIAAGRRWIEAGRAGNVISTVSAPGAWEQLFPPGSQVEAQERGVPLRRLGDHRELCDLYAYLAADGSGYMTGDLIVMDGGRWMQGAGGPTFRAMQDWNDAQWDAMRKK